MLIRKINKAIINNPILVVVVIIIEVLKAGGN